MQSFVKAMTTKNQSDIKIAIDEIDKKLKDIEEENIQSKSILLFKRFKDSEQAEDHVAALNIILRKEINVDSLNFEKTKKLRNKVLEHWETNKCPILSRSLLSQAISVHLENIAKIIYDN